MTNNGGSAFPTPVCNAPLTAGGSVGIYPQITQSGMSLRDYFASVALEHTRGQADKAGSADIERLFPGTGQVTREQIAARLAYMMADAMLAERAK